MKWGGADLAGSKGERCPGGDLDTYGIEWAGLSSGVGTIVFSAFVSLTLLDTICNEVLCTSSCTWLIKFYVISCILSTVLQMTFSCFVS